MKQTNLWRRFLSAVLTIAMLISLTGTWGITAQAASITETLESVNIYNGDYEMEYLAMNGAVKSQSYTYYVFKGIQGTTEIPAYCVNPTEYGVPQTVSPGEDIEYKVDKIMSDPKIIGILATGYPHNTLEAMGLDNKYQAFYATKMALWCYLISSWSIDKLTVNPRLTGSERVVGERILAAAQKAYINGTQWTSIPQPTITTTPDQGRAYPVTVEGREYYQQVFTVHSETWVGELSIDVKFAVPQDAAAVDAKIVDMENKEITTLKMDASFDGIVGSFDGQYKVLIPAENVDKLTGALEVNLAATVYKYEMVYAICAETDKYGNLQNYLLDTDPVTNMAVKGVFTPPDGQPDPPDDTETKGTSIKIVKLEEGTKTPLSGAVYEVVSPDGTTLGSYSTGTDGTVTIPITEIGNYTITEVTAPRYHLLPEQPTQQIRTYYGKMSTATFVNAAYGDLRVEKIDGQNGGGLAGAKVQIKHIESGATYTQETGPGGAAQFTQLKPGAYEIQELAAPEGWQKDPQTYTVNVVPGECVNFSLKNEALPGLKIIKYDSLSHTTMSHVTFEIFRDTVSLGRYETDALGEILLTDLQPGTYRVVEVDTGDTAHIVAPPQEIELTAAGGIKTLYFFNDTKPGMWLVKVDAADPSKVVPNAVFSIRAIDGSFGPKEFTTDQRGEIDLSELPTGSYEVVELSCPGYIVDKAQRIIHLEANQNARFVFTNSVEPSIHIIKQSSDGTPLPGVSFRIAKIEDGSHYLDRVTDQNGEIMISGLKAGVYSVVETVTVPDHILNPREHHVELFPGKTSTIVLSNDKKPNLIIHKLDAVSGAPIANTTFVVKYADGSTVTTVKTDINGEALVEHLDPGPYQIIEQSVPDGYLLDAPPQLITLEPNRTGHVYFQNHPKPSIDLTKTNIRGEAIPGAIFTLSEKNGTVIGDYEVGADGHLRVYGLKPGYYVLTEKSVPAPYILDTTPHEVELVAGKTTETTIINHKKPTLTIHKKDSVTGDPISGVRFQLWAAVNGSLEGNLRDLGVHTTDENGQIHLDEQDVGWVRVKELEPAPGYAIKEPATQDIFLRMDMDEELTFLNIPLSALVVYKYDDKTGEALEGAIFEVKYLGGTSGTGGTVIGTYKTSSNGSFVVTGLKAGSYVVSEVRSSPYYTIDTAPQTAYLTGKDQDVVTLYFGNQPYGSAIIKKMADDANKTPLAGAVFLVTDDKGAVIGNENGEFTTDKSGMIQLPKVPAGTSIVVREIRAPEGYALDEKPQTIRIEAGETMTLSFYDKPLCNLTILKRDSSNKQPLAGATFLVTDGAGTPIGPNNGRYTSGSDGLVAITGLTPGQTIIVREEQAPEGYIKDGEPKSIVVKSGVPNSLTFDNAAKGTLVILKLSGDNRKTPLEGAQFQVTTSSGEFVPTAGGAISSNGLYTTDKQGQITITGLDPDTYVVTEIKAPEGFLLDETPQTVVVNTNDTQSLRFYNTPTNTLTIQKYIEGTTTPIQGVTFLVTDSTGAIVGPNNGEYITDRNGRIVISGLTPGVTITAKEVKTVEGYELDSAPQSILIKEGEAQSFTFYNRPLCNLTILKRDSGSKEPLAGAEFLVTDGAGAPIGPNNGRYTSGSDGLITISGLTPGQTVAVRETKAPNGYILNTEPQTTVVRSGEDNRLTFENTPTNTLTIQKYIEGTTTPIQGVTFLVTDSAGAVVGPNNGEYITDRNGRIVISGLTPGVTITAKETKTAGGFVLDSAPQSILIKEGEAQTMTFYNQREGGLELIKVDADNKSVRIPNVEFEIRRMDGGLVDTFATDSRGRFHADLEAGDYYAVEVSCPKEYKLDPTPHYFTVRDGAVTELTVKNTAFSGILIHKIDSVSGKGIPNVSFILYDSGMNPIDQFTTDQNGDAYIDDLGFSGKVYLRELENAGYLPDTDLKTVYMKPGETTLITWKNTPITGQIQIIKKSADDNPINGLPAGTLLPGAVFEIYDQANNLVDTITSDKNGLAISKAIPLGRYTVRETKSPPYYGVNTTPVEAEIQFSGQIVKFEVLDSSAYANVSVSKKGYAEVVPGQTIRYDFREIANNSTMSLESFYFRDTLPTDAVRLDKIITGSWNQRLSYKVVYLTNLSGGAYRTLADSLSTAKVYTLESSPAALGLASNEYVTEVMFVFGTVPPGFRQVEEPAIFCTVLPNLINGYQFANKTDVGGLWNGQWIQAVDRWVTKVYSTVTPPTLPRTGY